MKKIKRPLLVNAGIVFLLNVLDYTFNSVLNTQLFPRFAFSGTLIMILAALNFLTGMVRNRNRTGDGPYYFLIAGVLLLIGFSVCTVSLR
jgi:hypothetical protein